MDKSDKLLEKCFKCKAYQENECGIYFMIALWQKECKFFMETNYQKYLNKLDLVDEETFNEILNSFPEIEDFDDVTICEDDICADDLCMSLFDYFLEDYPSYIYCEDVDFFSKHFSLYGSETVEELETIKNLFSKWEMINYEKELEDLKELEEEQKKESEEEELREDLINYISTASIEKLHNLKNLL